MTNNIQQQQFQSLDGGHSPSFETILQSVDLRGGLTSSKDSTIGQPLPLFSENPARDQILSGSDNVAQSQFQVSVPAPQIVQSNVRNNGGEVGQQGSAVIQRGTLLGSTIGEVINPRGGAFIVRNDDDDFDDDSNEVFLNQGFNLNAGNQQATLRLNNLGVSSFIGSSQGNPSQPQTLSVSEPQVIGVSLPQPVSVSPARPVTSNNQFFISRDDDSDEDFEDGQLLRLSRSQGSSTPNKRINALNIKVQDTKALNAFEKMLENSFAPDTEQDLSQQTHTRLIDTPDMSSLPLEKHTDSSSPVFPPFSGSSNRQQSTEIRKAVLK